MLTRKNGLRTALQLRQPQIKTTTTTNSNILTSPLTRPTPRSPATATALSHLHTTPSLSHPRHRPNASPSPSSSTSPYSSSSNTPTTNAPSIAVLGGGITGLATAYFLTQQVPRAKITLYEAGDRIGGWLESRRVEVEGGSVLFEKGPRTLRPAQNGVLAARLVGFVFILWGFGIGGFRGVRGGIVWGLLRWRTEKTDHDRFKS